MSLSFSVIIPCYNAADTLERCIERLRQQQSEHSVEIIVVDNGSSDRSREIADSLADLSLGLAEGEISAVRNYGAKKASGEILLFLDSDCLLDVDWIERASKSFEDESIVACGSKTHVLPEDATWVAKTWKIHLDLTEEEGEVDWLSTRAIAIRRRTFEKINGFDTSLKTCEDVALCHALGKEGKIISAAAFAPLHLKDADTLAELYSKECWRGSDSIITSLRQFKARPETILGKEGLSFILPFYFLVASFCFDLGILGAVFGWSLDFAGNAATAMILPLVALAMRTAINADRLDAFPALSVVYATYIAARASALLNSIGDALFPASEGEAKDKSDSDQNEDGFF